MEHILNKKISVIIPTLNAEKNIKVLLKLLLSQTILPDEIIVIDSSSDDRTKSICEQFDKVKFVSINRNDFDHGGTRTFAAKIAIGDYLLFMTQDAVPANDFYIEKLIKPLEQDNIPMASGCQYPRSDARYTEQLTRLFNYPGDDFVRAKKDIKQYGIKTFFSSDVCSAYRKKEYNLIGGFDHPLPTGEDMIIAAKFIYAGYSIAYVSNAKVVHSHNYNLWQQFSRNFDIGICLSLYHDYFKDVSLNSEGIKMVNFIFKKLLREKKINEFLYYFFECTAKFLGNKLGMKYKILPYFVIKKFSMNKNYWLKDM